MSNGPAIGSGMTKEEREARIGELTTEINRIKATLGKKISEDNLPELSALAVARIERKMLRLHGDKMDVDYVPTPPGPRPPQGGGDT